MDKQRGDALVAAMDALDEMKVLSLAVDMAAEGESSYLIFERLLEGVRAVDARYEAGEYFISDLIMAGHIMKSVMDKVLIFQEFEEYVSFGRVLVATAQGDIHELGKQVVVEVLQHNGFTVKDVGTDVPPNRIVDEIRAFSPDILMLSGTLSASADSIAEAARAVAEAGLRRGLCILAGGAAVSGRDPASLGIDGVCATAIECLKESHEFMALKAGER